MLELFTDYVEGDAGQPALVLSTRRLGETALNAVDKSLAAFGYGDGAFIQATTLPLDCAAEGGDIALDPQALFLLVEAVDPLMIVCTDAEATEALAAAYRTELRADSAARVFGRPSALFSKLDSLMESDAGKQKAWMLLKSLPRR